MIGPEVMRAFERWVSLPTSTTHPCLGDDCYPLYIGHPHNGRWYVRERMPGTRVWRAEEDGGFTLLDALDMPPGLASGASLRGCRERTW